MAWLTKKKSAGGELIFFSDPLASVGYLPYQACKQLSESAHWQPWGLMHHRRSVLLRQWTWSERNSHARFF